MDAKAKRRKRLKDFRQNAAFEKNLAIERGRLAEAEEFVDAHCGEFAKYAKATLSNGTIFNVLAKTLKPGRDGKKRIPTEWLDIEEVTP